MSLRTPQQTPPQEQHHLIDFNSPGQVLSAEQRQFYNKNGYLVIRNCVPQFELQRYLNRFYDICEGKDVPLDMTIARDVLNPNLQTVTREMSVSKLRDINHDPVLFDYCRCPTVSL